MNIDVEQIQRRTLRVLMTAQVLGGIGVISGLSVGALIAADVMGKPELSGLVQSSQVLGAAFLAVPAARLSINYGRRAGLGLGLVCGAIGALLAVVSAQLAWFPLLLVGTAFFGGGAAAGLQSRYAATDLAKPDRRARSLAFVIWSTTVGAITGPNLSEPAGHVAAALGMEPLSGGFMMSVIAFTAAALVAIFGLRPDSLALARQLSNRDATGKPAKRGWRASWEAAVRTPGGRLGLATVIASHTVMVAVMVMTPVHMHHGGAPLSVIGLVLSGHVAGMYAFSPVVGWLADRFGRVPMIAIGGLIFLTATLLAGNSPIGMSPGLPAGLFLLGLGWSCCIISGSALLSESVLIADRAAAQGLSDSLMGISAAAGGALAGIVVATIGYGALNAGAGLLATIPLGGALVALSRASRRNPSVAGE